MFRARVGDNSSEEGWRFLAERSPLTHEGRIVRPLLIGQGANDPRVKRSESDQIVGTMTGHETPVTYVLFPDEGHGFARPENNLAFMAIAEAFLAKMPGWQIRADRRRLRGIVC
jgi:dipeptidyl aminopeptidase/acylaminoacyl peptidase